MVERPRALRSVAWFPSCRLPGCVGLHHSVLRMGGGANRSLSWILFRS